MHEGTVHGGNLLRSVYFVRDTTLTQRNIDQRRSTQDPYYTHN